MVEITVVVATADASGPAAARAIAGYDRESAGVELQLLVYGGSPADDAWTLGAQAARCPFIHFTTDEYEPHPGWWQAATAASRAGVIPVPVLWTVEGECLSAGGDWKKCTSSRLPFLTRKQLAGTVPSFRAAWHPLLPFALRTEYAFTWHEAADAATPAGAPPPTLGRP